MRRFYAEHPEAHHGCNVFHGAHFDRYYILRTTATGRSTATGAGGSNAGGALELSAGYRRTFEEPRARQLADDSPHL